MTFRLNDVFDTADNLLGPYERWMFNIGKSYDLPDLMLDDGVRMSCVAEFPEPIDHADLLPVSKMTREDGQRYWVQIPTMYRNGAFKSRFVPFMLSPVGLGPGSNTLLGQTAARVSNLLVRFRTESSQPTVTRGSFRVNFPVREETIAAGVRQPVPPPAPSNLKKPKVLLAIIDLGIPFAHANFRMPGGKGTQIEYCWSQSAQVHPQAEGYETGDVLFGREFHRDQINGMVAAQDGDEDAIYRQAGLLNTPGKPLMPLDRMHSHGAHVMDAMAGNWPSDSAEDMRVIAVDLPSSSTWETSGFGKDMFELSALHYIFDRAERIKTAYDTADLPLVINLSYGGSGGPHDGTSLIEVAIAELIAARNKLAPTVIVMPSGNMFQDRLYAQLTDRHFSVDPADAGQKIATLDWFTPPNDRTSSYVELWYPLGTRRDEITVEVNPPGTSEWVSTQDMSKGDIGFFGANLEVDDHVVGQFTLDRYREQRWRVMIILAPTETFAPEQPSQGSRPHGPAPAGVWRLRFKIAAQKQLQSCLPEAAQGVACGGIECRIQRDTSYGQGNTGARQSYFLDPDDPRFAENGALTMVDEETSGAKLRRFGSINGMATDGATLVVGGHVETSLKAAAYSSAGTVSGGAGGIIPIGKQVDISASTERSDWLPGVIAAGTRSGITVSLRGTSSAAPQVARKLGVALMDPAHHGARTLPAFLALLSASPGVIPVEDEGVLPSGKLRLGGWVLE